MSEDLEQIAKEKFLAKIKTFKKGAYLSMTWDRNNGTITKILRYEGIDKNGVPEMYFPGNTRLRFDLIGGYNSVLSLQEECPNGEAAR